MKKILVVEDEESIREVIALNLRMVGYDVLEAGSAEEALHLFHESVDVAILDIMLPGMNGFSLCESIRRDSGSVGIIMLSAKSLETDKIKALSIGADDYMTKPFSVLELCARVRALLRRGAPQPKEGAASYGLQSGALQLHVGEHEVTLCGQAVELTLKEFMLLQELMECAPDSIARDTLLQKVWGYDYVGETRTLDMHIGTLRAKLQDDSANPNYIKTVRGIGYRFLQNVERVSGSTGRQAL